jgi:hypothetical protein
LIGLRKYENKQISDYLVQRKKFVCGSCGEESSSETCINESCGKYQKPTFKPCELITLPLGPQLQRLASENWQQICQNADSPNNDSSKICDITYGRRYVITHMHKLLL